MQGLDFRRERGAASRSQRTMGATRVPRRLHHGVGRRGPCFYVWDEDAREAESWAAELAQAMRPFRTTTARHHG